MRPSYETSPVSVPAAPPGLRHGVADGVRGGVPRQGFDVGEVTQTWGLWDLWLPGGAIGCVMML